MVVGVTGLMVVGVAVVPHLRALSNFHWVEVEARAHPYIFVEVVVAAADAAVGASALVFHPYSVVHSVYTDPVAAAVVDQDRPSSYSGHDIGHSAGVGVAAAYGLHTYRP